jgi:hypothetical protein
MTSASNDPVSATTLDPALCGICPNLATVTCSGCNNIKHCSQQCMQRDSEQHNTLCSTFQDFQQRPNENHYRSIYFPPNAFRPRFIWLRINGDRGGQRVDDEDLARYVSGTPSGRLLVETHHGLKREFKNFMVIEHDDNMFGNRQPRNQCLLRMIGPHAARWRGDYVAHAYKYTYSSDESSWDEEDIALGEQLEDFPLIALDLDTTTLGPLVAFLSWHARAEASGGFMFGL